MKYSKITHGFVIQTFNEKGEPQSQEFIAGDEVEYEQNNEPISPDSMPLAGDEYLPFDMLQPNSYKPTKMPTGYFGWALLNGESGMVILKDALHNLSASENGDRHQHNRGLLVGVVSTLCACGMTFEDAMQLVWQLSPSDIHPDRIPSGWEVYLQGKISQSARA